MNNKLLVIIYVPLLNESYDVFIPVNRKIGTIRNLIIDRINELNNNSIENVKNLRLYNKDNCKIYDNNIYVKNSDIKNGSILMLI